MHPRSEPRRHQIRPALSDLAQHPADRLADEELLLVQHRVGVAAEPLEVATARSQRPEQRKNGRSAQPKVAVTSPAVECIARLRPAADDVADHVDGEPVHQGPGSRRPQQVLEQVNVGRAELAACAFEQDDSDCPALIQRVCPQRRDQPGQLIMLQSGPGLRPASHHCPDGRDACPGEFEVALEVGLLGGGPRGIANLAECAFPVGCLRCPAGRRNGHHATLWMVADSTFGDLIRRPVIVAPMAGGPTTTKLIAAAAQVGAVGFIPAGYKSAQAMRADIDAVTAVTREPFGVNVFVPGVPADSRAVARYLESIASDAAALGTEAGGASWDDDDWHAKIADLIARPVPIVSFTFGCPEPAVVADLRAAGTSVWVTVTDPAEAATALSAGVACLCVQGAEAGAHRGTFTNAPGGTVGVVELIAAIRAVASVPLVAAGGIMD